MKHICICHVRWTNKIVATGHQKIHKGSFSVLSTGEDWLSGVGSQLLELLVLTSLKTTKVQRLLWNPKAMWQCYATSVNQNYVDVESIPHQYGFSKMEQQASQQGHQWVFCGKIFPLQVISRGGYVPWPARLPDLSACYYCLWVYL